MLTLRRIVGLLTLCSLLFLLSARVKGQAQSGRKRKPNIIYVYADDLGYAELGSYGQKKIRTPNLDKMANDGVRFTQHYTSAPVCAPSRAMMLTGKHGGHSYIRGNYEMGGFSDELEGGQMPLPEGVFTLPRMLKNAGYTTALVGKWGLGMPQNSGSPLKHGFDHYYGYLDQKQAHNFYPTHLWEDDRWDKLNNPVINVHKRLDPATATDADFNYYRGSDYAPGKMTEKALNFIEKNKDRPFFLYFPTPLPHVSLQAPDSWVSKYLGQFQETPYFGQQGYASTKYPLSTYAAMVSYVDDQVGQILAMVRKLGLDENTIIMFSSDNGTTFNGGTNAQFFESVGGLRGLKMDLYEGGIREPFIVRWTGTIKPRVTDHISAQYDLLATIAEITGQTLPNRTDGLSFFPELLGQHTKQKAHEYLYFEYPEKGGQVAIRLGDWKGVRTAVRANPKAGWQIFDLKSDPGEKTDISAQHPELVKRFDEIQKKEHQCSHLKEWEFIDPRFETPRPNQ